MYVCTYIHIYIDLHTMIVTIKYVTNIIVNKSMSMWFLKPSIFKYLRSEAKYYSTREVKYDLINKYEYVSTYTHVNCFYAVRHVVFFTLKTSEILGHDVPDENVYMQYWTRCKCIHGHTCAWNVLPKYMRRRVSTRAFVPFSIYVCVHESYMCAYDICIYIYIYIYIYTSYGIIHTQNIHAYVWGTPK